MLEHVLNHVLVAPIFGSLFTDFGIDTVEDIIQLTDLAIATASYSVPITGTLSSPGGAPPPFTSVPLKFMEQTRLTALRDWIIEKLEQGTFETQEVFGLTQETLKTWSILKKLRLPTPPPTPTPPTPTAPVISISEVASFQKGLK